MNFGSLHGETTTNGKYTLESVACLGCCSLAPVMMIGEEVYGRLSPKELKRIIKEYRKKHANDEVAQV